MSKQVSSKVSVAVITSVVLVLFGIWASMEYTLDDSEYEDAVAKRRLTKTAVLGQQAWNRDIGNIKIKELLGSINRYDSVRQTIIREIEDVDLGNNFRLYGPEDSCGVPGLSEELRPFLIFFEDLFQQQGGSHVPDLKKYPKSMIHTVSEVVRKVYTTLKSRRVKSCSWFDRLDVIQGLVTWSYWWPHIDRLGRGGIGGEGGFWTDEAYRKAFDRVASQGDLDRLHNDLEIRNEAKYKSANEMLRSIPSYKEVTKIIGKYSTVIPGESKKFDFNNDGTSEILLAYYGYEDIYEYMYGGQRRHQLTRI